MNTKLMSALLEMADYHDPTILIKGMIVVVLALMAVVHAKPALQSLWQKTLTEPVAVRELLDLGETTPFAAAPRRSELMTSAEARERFAQFWLKIARIEAEEQARMRRLDLRVAAADALAGFDPEVLAEADRVKVVLRRAA